MISQVDIKQMSESAFDRLFSSEHERKLLAREDTIMEITEMLCAIMKEKGISRASLAKRLGKSRSSVSQLLNGERNFTVSTVSDILFAMDETLVALHRGIDEPPCEYLKIEYSESQPLSESEPDVEVRLDSLPFLPKFAA